MEKKTIGKFIAVLRKANGMTQKELGDRLFVSDKTVSRWERDECTPELSLIPVIAEIFGITTDELLRGERRPLQAEGHEEEKGRENTPKSDRQLRFMLHNRMKKYRILTLISVGIAILGLIAAAVANLAFSEGLIGFCLAAVCIVAAAICQTIFAVNAYLLVDEEDTHVKEMRDANSAVTLQTVRVFFALVAELAFCLPIVLLTYGGVNYGLMLESWLPYGTLCTLVVLFSCDLLYKLWIKRLLVNRGLLFVSEKEEAQNAACIRVLKRTMALCLSSLAVIGAVAFVFSMIGAEPYIEKKYLMIRRNSRLIWRQSTTSGSNTGIIIRMATAMLSCYRLLYQRKGSTSGIKNTALYMMCKERSSARIIISRTCLKALSSRVMKVSCPLR